MDPSSLMNLYVALIFIIGGIAVYIYDKIHYPIKVKGECLKAELGKWANHARFRYVIDGVEYIGIGPCGAYPKKVGKYYTIWVNKDDHEKYTMTSMKIGFILVGLMVLNFVKFR